MQIIDGKPIYESSGEKQAVEASDKEYIHLSNNYLINGKSLTKESSELFIDDIIKKLIRYKSKNVIVNSALLQMTFINLDKVEGEWNGI